MARDEDDPEAREIYERAVAAFMREFTQLSASDFRRMANNGG